MCACSWRYHPVLFFWKNISIRWSNVCLNGVILGLKNPQFRTKSRYFTDNPAGWNLATISFHQHVRLLMEIPFCCTKNGGTWRLIRLLRRMRLINKFLSPKCAHGLGDVGERNLFLSAIRRSNRRSRLACVKSTKTDVTSKKIRHCNIYSDLRSKYFFKKKYVSTSPSPGAHFGERNLFLSRIWRSNRIESQVRSFFVEQKGRSHPPPSPFGRFLIYRDSIWL